jgi:hypothetical protein
VRHVVALRRIAQAQLAGWLGAVVPGMQTALFAQQVGGAGAARGDAQARVAGG